MKTRRVVVVLEVDTDTELNRLRRVDCWHRDFNREFNGVVIQAQANVQRGVTVKRRPTGSARSITVKPKDKRRRRR